MAGAKKEFKETAKKSAARSTGVVVGSAAPYLLGLAGAGVVVWLVLKRLQGPTLEVKGTVDRQIKENYYEKSNTLDNDAVRELINRGDITPVQNRVIVDDFEAQGLHVMTPEELDRFSKDPDAYMKEKADKGGWEW